MNDRGAVMSPEFDKKLCDNWPLIFADRQGDSTHTAMCHGFECGDGWFGLIYGLCEALQQETDLEGAPQVVALQVKEKFGSLRFRVRTASDRQRAMILAAEIISTHIAED
jgi:hypothetical protein